MADEQTPRSDLIEDALRQAERQLEARLEALRASALGEVAPTPVADDVAVLRPTGGATRSSGTDVPSTVPDSWAETDGDDLMFAPSGGVSFDEPTDTTSSSDEGARDAELAPTSSVSDLVADWEQPSELDDAPHADGYDEWHPEPAGPSLAAVAPQADEPDPWTPRDERWAPEPVESRNVSWRDSDPIATTSLDPTGAGWTEATEAVRSLRRLITELPEQVAGHVTGQMTDAIASVVRAEADDTARSIRQVQTQVQQGLPRVSDRIEGAIEQSAKGSATSMRQLREELPDHIERVARELRTALRDDLGRSSAKLHEDVQENLGRLEQSVAGNVLRIAEEFTDTSARVEREMVAMGDSVGRVERGVNNQFEHVEAELRSALERVEANVGEQLAEPVASMARVEREVGERIARVEQAVVQRVDDSHLDLGTALGHLVEANRAALDRMAVVASTLDEDRARRAEEVAVVVDTVTTGWEGLAGAVKALYEQNVRLIAKIDTMETRIGELRDLEGAVEGQMEQLRGHVASLSPAPVVVTVSHPEAEVRNTTRGGWTPDADED